MIQTGFSAAEILLPHSKDLTRWSVAACDQYTSEPQYWQRVESFVGAAPSALRLVLPEVWLGQPDEQQRIEQIHRTMQAYLDNDQFELLPDSMIYLERTLAPGKVRHGLIGKLDLLCYDYASDTKSLVRPTEGTVEDRLPPRIRVRQGAPLELPHVMLLVDDPQQRLFGPVCARRDRLRKVYDFALMEQGGHAAGWQLDQTAIGGVQQALDALYQDACAGGTQNPLLFAVGDGNHSLATAKACFEQLCSDLSPAEWMQHPARWALVELVNLHDPSLQFEPIHRVLFGAQPQPFLEALGRAHRLQELHDPQPPAAGVQQFTLLAHDQQRQFAILDPCAALTVGTLQAFLDKYLAAQPQLRLDYIHGEDAMKRLCSQPDTIGLLLPPMRKETLFPSVQQDGALPRKTFSMGHAQEKRFYLEARSLT